jgi:hypothetical protein
MTPPAVWKPFCPRSQWPAEFAMLRDALFAPIRPRVPLWEAFMAARLPVNNPPPSGTAPAKSSPTSPQPTSFSPRSTRAVSTLPATTVTPASATAPGTSRPGTNSAAPQPIWTSLAPFDKSVRVSPLVSQYLCFWRGVTAYWQPPGPVDKPAGSLPFRGESPTYPYGSLVEATAGSLEMN